MFSFFRGATTISSTQTTTTSSTSSTTTTTTTTTTTPTMQYDTIRYGPDSDESDSEGPTPTVANNKLVDIDQRLKDLALHQGNSYQEVSEKLRKEVQKSQQLQKEVDNLKKTVEKNERANQREIVALWDRIERIEYRTGTGRAGDRDEFFRDRSPHR